MSINAIGLSNTQISDTGIKILTPYLESNKTFKRLFIAGNEGITDRSIPFLVKMVETSSLDDIDIDGSSIVEKHIIYISLVCNRIKIRPRKLTLSFA